MARFDAIGLFWEDRAPEKPPKKEKVRPTPPNPVWLLPDYLPHLDEAKAFKPDLFTDEELVKAQKAGEVLIWDIESYPNYFLLAMRSEQSGKCLVFESDEKQVNYQPGKLRWVLENFLLVDFNGDGYDKWIAQVAARPKGVTARQAWELTDRLINQREKGHNILRSLKVKKMAINHIDVISLTPGDNDDAVGGARGPSLKMMAGRLESPMMMDLPYPPGVNLTEDQKIITFWYCFNDISNTELVYKAHKKNIALREKFGAKYKVDLRSKSDAQMAEAIFRVEALRRTGDYPQTPKVVPGFQFKFRIPDYVNFQTENLKWVLSLLQDSVFTVGESGYVSMPDSLKKLKIPIGDGEYTMGIGGLHSNEKRICHIAGERYILRDHDVASYYPKLIIATGLEPPALRGIFRHIYPGLVAERLHAKQIGDKVAADGLKIVVNGSFGKTLDPFSCLYYPQLGIQTTLSGQLSLLMAIERLTLAGLQVINANTDGIVVKCPIEREPEMVAIFKEWEKETGLEMETTDYTMVFSRDVNNYLAFKPNGEVKTKGVFGVGDIKHNPANDICAEAVVAYLTTGRPIEDTVKSCKHFPRFLEVRRVTGGAAKIWDDGSVEFVGKIARWYHSTEVSGPIITAKRGHMVPASTGARPCMRLPDQIPSDLDYNWYIQESYDLLDAIGYNDLFNPQPVEQVA